MRGLMIVKEFTRDAPLPSVAAGAIHRPGYAVLPDETADVLVAEGLARELDAPEPRPEKPAKAKD